MMTEVGETVAAEVGIQPDSLEREIDIDFSKAAQDLAEGLLAVYSPPLEQIKKELHELTEKQETLLSQMRIENKKLQDTLDNVQLNELFSMIKIYQVKLTAIKKEMTAIHERTFRLKKRALRLQHIKQKEALSREQHREQEIRREQELIGKATLSHSAPGKPI
ncbi:biogenesis of lysosome-related organelles complex 1 subunit 6-like [Orussus abietinus]|uniref:biogenesis of lysosome-related organelles complex 1 subunit 6-like n=1 Tax=Orussus abietinus TaxID=222816 RepID=UPI00062650FC|nr:biogenesis of lysosome-related organelles complex 1 subunit 6-like [Orussus abietinus]